MSRIKTAVCPLCGSPARSRWPSVNVCQCRTCRLLFRHPAVPPEELAEIYRRGWAEPDANLEETGATTDDLAAKYVLAVARDIGRTDLKGLRVLDFGAGKGSVLRALDAAGADVAGVEPYGTHALQRDGFRLYSRLEDIPPNVAYDGIVTFDVVEHLQTPWADYRRLRSLLRAGGWIHVSTPNAAGANAVFFGKRWREFRNRGHYYFFNARTLERVLQRSGLSRIRRLRWYMDFGGGPISRLAHRPLQLLRLDGELRYLAYK